LEVDQLITALRGQGEVEVLLLDIAKVDQDSAQGTALALLEIEGLDHLLAGDLAHLGEHAADGPALELGDVECRRGGVATGGPGSATGGKVGAGTGRAGAADRCG